MHELPAFLISSFNLKWALTNVLWGKKRNGCHSVLNLDNHLDEEGQRTSDNEAHTRCVRYSAVSWKAKLLLSTSDRGTFSVQVFVSIVTTSDYHFFPYLMKRLVRNNDEIKSAADSCIKNKSPKFFSDGSRKLVIRWKNCIRFKGDLVEKWVL